MTHSLQFRLESERQPLRQGVLLNEMIAFYEG